MHRIGWLVIGCLLLGSAVGTSAPQAARCAAEKKALTEAFKAYDAFMDSYYAAVRDLIAKSGELDKAREEYKLASAWAKLAWANADEASKAYVACKAKDSADPCAYEKGRYDAWEKEWLGSEQRLANASLALIAAETVVGAAADKLKELAEKRKLIQKYIDDASTALSRCLVRRG